MRSPILIVVGMLELQNPFNERLLTLPIQNQQDVVESQKPND
jgi:hypothetical protein